MSLTARMCRLTRRNLSRRVKHARCTYFDNKARGAYNNDFFIGQMIRLLHGFKSEEERNDIIRRTQNGRRERVLKDHKLLGNHPNKYGWKYADEDKGTYILDQDPIKIPLDGTILRNENGEVWTKAKVRRHMFECDRARADNQRLSQLILHPNTSQRIGETNGIHAW